MTDEIIFASKHDVLLKINILTGRSDISTWFLRNKFYKPELVIKEQYVLLGF